MVRYNKSSSSMPLIIFLIVLLAIAIYGVKKYPRDIDKDIPLLKGGLTKEEVEKIVKEYILAHPEDLLQSIEHHQSKKIKEIEEKTKATISQKKAEIENSSTSPITGNPKGSIILVEFFDYNCGYCKKVNKTITELLNTDKDVKFVFKELPILGEASLKASKAALAVHIIAPQKYVSFHNELMQSPRIDDQLLADISNKLALDYNKIKEVMESKQVSEELAKVRELANQLNVSGIPTFFINGEPINGEITIDFLKKKINQLRGYKDVKPQTTHHGQ